MSRKNREKKRQNSPSAPPAGASAAPVKCDTGGITPAGWKLLLLSAVLAASGYFLLGKADPTGSNLAARLAPFLLLSGYLLVIPAILLKPSDPPEDPK